MINLILSSAMSRTVAFLSLLTLSQAIHAEPWLRHTIDDSARGADGVRLADINGDGRLDIATGWEEAGLVADRADSRPGGQATVDVRAANRYRWAARDRHCRRLEGRRRERWLVGVARGRARNVGVEVSSLARRGLDHVARRGGYRCRRR